MDATKDGIERSLSRYVVGPRLPVPAGSPHSLEALQEVRWGVATPNERREAEMVARTFVEAHVAPLLERISSLRAGKETGTGGATPS